MSSAHLSRDVTSQLIPLFIYSAFALTALDVPTTSTSADDRRFLMLQANPSSQLQLVQNWFDELRRRVPLR